MTLSILVVPSNRRRVLLGQAHHIRDAITRIGPSTYAILERNGRVSQRVFSGRADRNES
jgi:hypothetical protein